MINKELLDKIIRKSDICKFECIFDDISGVPVKYNEKYIMVNIYEDFQFDGFCIFDITEIENICYDETYEFINHICKEEKIYPPKVENINIENFTNVFNYFKNNEENIIVECGGYDDEDYNGMKMNLIGFIMMIFQLYLLGKDILNICQNIPIN